jgi:5'-nucleotidase (lipoprotein e(P4) family)
VNTLIERFSRRDAAPEPGAAAIIDRMFPLLTARTPKTRYALLLLLALASVSCRSARTTSLPTPTPPPAAASTAGAAAVPDSVKWVRSSAEYMAAFEQTYRLATARVETESRTHTVGSWAVILDADETVLNNSLYQEERARAGLGFSEESWAAWVKRREATPLPGVATFLTRTRQLGGRIAIVTNRLLSVCPDTEAVFARYQLVYDAMLCRVDGTPSDKNPRFQAVAAGRTPAGPSPLDVVAYVGDNILDFPGLSQSVRSQGAAALADFGSRFFLLPNPMYGSWQ